MNTINVAEVYSSNSYNYATKFYRPWREHTETYTVLNAMVDGQNLNNDSLTGMNVLDIACGGGHYAREYLKLGAERVVGLDISQGQVDNAILFSRTEGFKKSRFDFYCADCGDLEEVKRSMENESVKQFDIITAVWLLGNAPNRVIHRKMMDVVSYFLKPGGKFVTITSNPVSYYNEEEVFKKTLPYGLLYERTEPENGVLKRRISFYDREGSYMFAVYNYVYSIQEVEEDFTESGFCDIKHQALEVSPEGSSDIDSGFESFLRNIDECHALLVVAKKREEESNIG